MAVDEPYGPGAGATIAGALVTGAGKRIGRAIALSLGRQGWKVAVHYHGSRSEADTVVQEIRSAGGEAISLQADLSREEEVLRLMPEAERALGPITLLVNNASVFEMDKIETVTRDSWDRHIETGLRAPLVLIQELSRRLPADAKGNVINMLDERVWALTPYFLSYTVAKAGLWTLTQTLALGLAPRIRVNGIGPGPTLPSPRQTDEQFREQWRRMPLGRGTTPEEIARAVEFILAAPAMTGQMIALDGGQHLGWAVPQPRRVDPE
ncbi:MAG: short chain dehydrogenase [Rhodospirillales bacterium]|nr:short chain dehydrogenase [Rhodospirillales bacterium]